jgi:hypothetical protein
MFVEEKRQGEITTKYDEETWRQVLSAAADFLETRLGGWCQGCLMDCMGQVCMLGAITMAPQTWRIPMGLRDSQVRSQAQQKMSKFLGMLAHRWNDEPGRTKEEVITALRACAAGNK